MLGSSFSHTCILSASMSCGPPSPLCRPCIHPVSAAVLGQHADRLLWPEGLCLCPQPTRHSGDRALFLCTSLQGFSVPCRVRPESSQWPARLSPSWAPYCTPGYLLPQGLCMAILSPIYDAHGSLPLPILAQPALSQADVPFDSGPLVLAFLAPSSCYGFLHSIYHHVP